MADERTIDRRPTKPPDIQALIAAGMAAGAAVWTWRRYRRDLVAAHARLQGRSQIAQTVAGPIEYGQTGTGQPVLIVHGSAGGFDQGLLLAEVGGPSFRWIAPSRFGYLRTPLPADHTPKAQADAHAALLDALRVPRAVVVGISAGGPSCLHFALRHPDRCAALIMISALSRPLLPAMPPLASLAGMVMASDFPYWLASRFEPLLLKSLGVSAEVMAGLSPADRAWVDAFVQTTLPIRARRTGIVHDLSVTATAPAPALARIAAPTLVLHAADDALAPLAHAEFTAGHIAGARLVVLPSGGHLLLGQHGPVRSEIVAFIAQGRSGPTP